MKFILSQRNRAILKKFASENVLVAFDFDGTLAPIVSDPDGAGLRPSTQKLLRRVTQLYPCIVVSGRSRKDVRQKLAGVHFREYIGNHGIEPWSSSSAMARKVEAWIPVLTRKLEHLHGVLVENKRLSVSVHFRHERNKKRAIETIEAVAGGLPGARVFGGKQVVNIVPIGAPGKGIALKRALREIGCAKAIYVGDDVTDEDVFAMGQNGRFLTIRVAANGSSLARFYIRDQREIDPLLTTLIEQRTKPKRE
jgi:trehalose 6-phosphate phosphatase